MTGDDWAQTRAPFNYPHGVTNVWQRPALRGAERIKTNDTSGRAVHLNQKPLDLMERIVSATTAPGSVVWEPFGGLFAASVAARRLGLRSFAGEAGRTYFHYGLERVNQEARQHPLL